MKKSLLVIVLLGLSATAAAGEAHFCGSPEVSALETGRQDVTDSTVFTCGGGIKGTLPDLAEFFLVMDLYFISGLGLKGCGQLKLKGQKQP